MSDWSTWYTPRSISEVPKDGVNLVHMQGVTNLPQLKHTYKAGYSLKQFDNH